MQGQTVQGKSTKSVDWITGEKVKQSCARWAELEIMHARKLNSTLFVRRPKVHFYSLVSWTAPIFINHFHQPWASKS